MLQPIVVPLTRQHFAPAQALMGRAFADYPLLRYVVPDERRRLRAAGALYGAVIRYGLRYGACYVTKPLDGIACWLSPERPFPTFFRMVRAGMLTLPLQFAWISGWASYTRLEAFDRVAQRMHHQHAAGPHWYLWAIGVAPERQGHGVGRSLMQPALARADADGLPCYLETHKEANTLIYSRVGFRVVGESGVQGHPGTIWGMLRDPGARPLTLS